LIARNAAIMVEPVAMPSSVTITDPVAGPVLALSHLQCRVDFRVVQLRIRNPPEFQHHPTKHRKIVPQVRCRSLAQRNRPNLGEKTKEFVRVARSSIASDESWKIDGGTACADPPRETPFRSMAGVQTVLVGSQWTTAQVRSSLLWRKTTTWNVSAILVLLWARPVEATYRFLVPAGFIMG
jgi:hypothetical protein